MYYLIPQRGQGTSYFAQKGMCHLFCYPVWGKKQFSMVPLNSEAQIFHPTQRVLKNISLVKYFFQHEKRNFVSPSNHVMFYLLYKHQ